MSYDKEGKLHVGRAVPVVWCGVVKGGEGQDDASSMGMGRELAQDLVMHVQC